MNDIQDARRRLVLDEEGFPERGLRDLCQEPSDVPGAEAN